MADKDPEGDGPSLELPSFGFGRKKKAKASDQDAPVEDAAASVEPIVESEPEPAPEPGPVVPETAVPETAVPETAVPETAVPDTVALEAVATKTEPDGAPESEVTQPRPKREFSLPALPALQAAMAVGLLIGLLAVLLTFASLKLCELVRGTDSCGGPGLLLLVATLVVLTYFGGWLLRAFGIDDPGSTSFLAVGLLAVLAMLLFLDVIYNWWMIIVIPVVAMATYALSWWVTTRFVDVGD